MRLLYYGDNGVHEFWESTISEDVAFLIFRNHGEKHWTAHRKYRIGRNIGFAYLFAAKTAREAAKRLQATLDTSKRWRKCGRGFTLANRRTP